MLVSLVALTLLGQRGEPSIKSLCERARPSVVSIEAETEEGTSTGTGFFYGDGKTVVTCLHIIEDALSIRIVDGKGKNWVPQTVAVDVAGDLAILRLSGATGHVGLPHAPSHEVEIGDEVIVIGDPLGLRGSLSTGVVGALRSDKGVPLVQITAPISEGSSGGPVLDRRGRVVGVVSFYFSDGQNLNMAISTQVAKWVLARNREMSYSEFLAMLTRVRQAVDTEREKPPLPSSRGTDKPEGGRGTPPPLFPESKARKRARAALTEQFARHLTELFIAHSRWEQAWCETVDAARIDHARLTDQYEEFSTLLASLIRDLNEGVKPEDIRDAGVPRDTQSRLIAYLKRLERISTESIRSEHDCLKTLSGGKRELEEANDRQITQRALRHKGVTEFASLVIDQIGLDEAEFSATVHPVVLGASILGVYSGFPDYDSLNSPIVGGISQPSPLKRGDVITGIGLVGESSFTTITSWKEIYAFIRERYEREEPENFALRIKRGGTTVLIDRPGSGAYLRPRFHSPTS